MSGAGAKVAWFALITAFLPGALEGLAAAGDVGVVCNVTVLSDKVEDVSNLAAWRASWIKPGMTDEQKALAVWETVVKYRHQTNPPNEYALMGDNVHDVMKAIHVYGYGMCCCAAANIEQLGRTVGLKARGRIIRAHSVPELFYDGAWHLFDASLINYHRKPDGTIASVDEIIEAVQQWHAAHSGYARNEGKLRAFARDFGWRKGPALLAGSEFYTKDGWNLAGTHGWPSTMQEFDCKPGQVYEYGYSQGYRPNVQLRPGERLARNWFNKGLHVNMDGGQAPGCLEKRAGMGPQRKLGDIAPGRVGNGTREYDVPLADGTFRTGALVAENLASKSEAGAGPAVRVKDPAKPGVLVIRMPSSYVYLTGKLALDAVVGEGGALAVGLSGNNGLDWQEIARVGESGRSEVDLSKHVLRRYDYRLRLELRGKGTGLEALKITHDVQHSQAPLPALGPGENTVTFRAGPAEGTVTIEGKADTKRKRNELLLSDFHPQVEGLAPQYLRVEGYDPAGGMVTFPIATPGDMVRLRFGAHWRARDQREGWEMLASFDGGKTFRKAGSMDGPMAGSCTYVTVEDIPAGTRSALVRFKSTRQRNTLCLFDIRIDADYAEPSGGFRPVKVTYVWEEAGAEKRHEHVARTPRETYAIRCGNAPLMKSLIVELAE
ncbi:MAG TPA: hypothetical protein VM695_16640 [Phycisphaerae bacterium]|nr:hypothetical protein [Phycisphaerae bacterium]